MCCVLVNNFRDIFVGDIIFARANRILYSIDRFLYDHAVKKLKDISKYSRSVSTIKLFNNKNIVLLRVVISISKDCSKRARDKFICDLIAIIRVNNRQYLTNKIRVRIIWMKNQPLDNPTRIVEFRQLNTAVEESLMRNQELFEQQKTFLGSASHELQTPIAATMNRLEIMLDDESLSEEQIGNLLKAIHSLENMSQLNRSLLMLSRIENGQFNDTQGVDFPQLTEEILAELLPLYASRKIKVEKHWIAPFVPVIDPTLARMMLSNLLKNAFVHSGEGSCFTLTSHTQGFSIANDGMQPLDANRIFEPLYHETATPSNQDEERNSTGIGLALVRAICTQSGLKVDYSFEENRHVFRIC